jgi:arginine decarboxylase
LHRLHESKKDFATLVDVTCDSDGKIDKFVDLKDVKETLELPAFRKNEDYYLGIFLVGAYQEVMGNQHNLFGLPNEAQVIIEEDGTYSIKSLVPGSDIEDMVQFARYDSEGLISLFQRKLYEMVTKGELSSSDAEMALSEYQDAANWSTYLE